MKDIHKLYNKHAEDIYRFSLFLCNNSTDAEDITAETFVTALTAKTELRSATVKGYLLTIARNLYFESLRRKKRRGELPLKLQDPGPGPERTASQKIELEAVQNWLQTVPETDRAALLLRAEGVGYNEIAETLNISLSAAKVKVHRMRMKLVKWRADRGKN